MSFAAILSACDGAFDKFLATVKRGFFGEVP